MTARVLPPGVPDKGGRLFNDEDRYGYAIAPLYSLTGLLHGVAGPLSWRVVMDIQASYSPPNFTIPLSPVEIEAMRVWPEGLRAVLDADASYDRFSSYRSSMTACVAFLPLAPVLSAWRHDLGESEEEASAQRWLDRQDWSVILAIAKRRDAAARAVITGSAFFHDTSIVLLRRSRGANDA